MMTPLYWHGNVYWVNGDGHVWALNATTGKPIAPFVNASGDPTLSLGGFNTINSATLAVTADGAPIMVVGTAQPGKLYGINLNTDQVVWTQSLAQYALYSSGFGDVTPAYDPANGLVIADVLVNPTKNGTQATEMAYAINPATGSVRWTQLLGTGAIPDGFTGSVPMIHSGTIYIGNPLTHTETALKALSGAIIWSKTIGVPIEAPGAIINNTLVVAGGADLIALNATSGQMLHTLTVGGDFIDNNPSVVGKTLYIGNAWGWALAIPLSAIV